MMTSLRFPVMAVGKSLHLPVLLLLLTVVIVGQGSRSDITPIDDLYLNVTIPPRECPSGMCVYEEEEGSGSEDDCWSLESCHPNVRNPDSIACATCPSKDDPSSWRKEDIGLSLHCQTGSAKIQYNLSQYLELDDPWLSESWALHVSFKTSGDGVVEEQEVRIEDLKQTQAEIEGLCSGFSYDVCLDLVEDGQVKASFCEDCTPHGVPPYNPTEIIVEGGVTYMDVQWKPVELQCPDIKYQILINGTVEESTWNGTDQTKKWIWNHPQRVSRINPGKHRISVQTVNREGASEGELTYQTYETFITTPPILQGVQLEVEDEQLVAVIFWEPTMKFSPSDITMKGYYLTFYNMSSVVEDEVMDEYQIPVHIEETSYRVNLSDAEGWGTQYSLQTYLGKTKSTETERQPLFSEGLVLLPPDNVATKYDVVNGELVAVLSWDYVLDPNLPKGFNGLNTLITLQDGEGNTRAIEKVAWPSSSVELKLGEDLPWDTEISLQTGVMEGRGAASQGGTLWAGRELSTPHTDTVSVEYDVREGRLLANVSWENNMDVEFNGLETVLEVLDRDTGRLVVTQSVPYPESWVTVGLEDMDSWNCNFTLHTAAGGGRGEQTPPLPLFTDIDLSRPEQVEVKTVVEEDVLMASISWENTVMDGADVKQLSTQVRLMNRNGSSLENITVTYPESQFNISLTPDLPWDVQFVLITMGMEEEGEQTQARSLFAEDEDLDPPENVLVTHSVKDKLLRASLTWDHSVQSGPFQGLVTYVKLYTENGTLIDSNEVPHTETRFSVGYQDPLAVKWGTEYSLRTCVGEIYCGEESHKESLFPNSLLTPPKDIAVSHGYDATQQAVFALITWENSIEEEFSDLFTVLNTWVPESNGNRKKREVLTYNDIAIPFSDTTKQISILDVDQRTVFSLQTAIGNISGNVTGEESDPMDLFDESLVKLEPPTEIEIEQSKVIDKTLTSDIGWVPSPLSPPTYLNIYDGDGQLLRRTKMEDNQDRERVRLEGDLPWDATFTLSSSYRPGEDKESEKQRLFLTTHIGDTTSQPQLGLTPPIIYNITVINSSSSLSSLFSSSSSRARVDWNHTMEPFTLLYTVVSVWREDGSLYSSQEVAWEGEGSNTVELEVEEEAVKGASVSLQNRVGQVFSPPGDKVTLFPEDWSLIILILIIIALTLFLILCILLTVCCLRKLCKKKGKLDVTKPKDSDPGTPGNYSSSSGGFNETKPLMGNGHNTGIPSDSGSDNTDQSLLSEEPLCNQSEEPLCSTPLPPSLLYPGDSMVTLNKFTDEDDGFFLGGFSEDGSFIGDYMDTDPDTSRAVMNRLVGFNQLFSKKF